MCQKKIDTYGTVALTKKPTGYAHRLFLEKQRRRYFIAYFWKNSGGDTSSLIFEINSGSDTRIAFFEINMEAILALF
jgi:hypothetical protein